MPPNKRTAELHGVSVSQIQLQGNYYTPVDARVKIAEQADPAKIRREGAGYNVLSVQFVQIGDRWAYHCLVEYPAGSGIVTPGTDFIDLKDAAGMAKAETSAIGRALGLHGIASEESVASAEEMSRIPGDNNAPVARSEPNLTAQPELQVVRRPQPDPTGPATVEQVQRMQKYREALGIDDQFRAKTDNGLNYGMADAQISAYIEQWKKRQVRA